MGGHCTTWELRHQPGPMADTGKVPRPVLPQATQAAGRQTGHPTHPPPKRRRMDPHFRRDMVSHLLLGRRRKRTRTLCAQMPPYKEEDRTVFTMQNHLFPQEVFHRMPPKVLHALEIPVGNWEAEAVDPKYPSGSTKYFGGVTPPPGFPSQQSSVGQSGQNGRPWQGIGQTIPSYQNSACRFLG